MGKLPVVSGREAIKALSRIGFVEIRQAGSHVVLQKKISAGSNTLVVPDHPELAKGTLRAIIRKSGLTVDEFSDLL